MIQFQRIKNNLIFCGKEREKDKIRSILQKLDIKPVNPKSFEIFIASLKTILETTSCEGLESLVTWKVPIVSNIHRLNQDEIDFINSELSKVNIPVNECQVEVQKSIPQEERKKFAAYYTIDEGIQLMESLVYEYLKTHTDRKIVLADPFLGSARTLMRVVQKIGVDRLQLIWGVEPLNLPALVAYASLIFATGGKKEIINVIVGDVFRKLLHNSSTLQLELPKTDIILTNPPFTRWKYLEKNYRDYILKVITSLGYGKYITRKEISLQILSMFLVDYVLNEEGLIVSVLPASTFYTIYGKGYKSFLMKNYNVLALIANTSRPSFSEDSGFKEVILVAEKKPNRNRNIPTAFIKLDNNSEKISKIIMQKFKCKNQLNSVNFHEMPQFMYMNWLSFFEENKLKDIVINIFKECFQKGTLKLWDNVLGRKNLIRGIEMYGPEFFFIPNKYWQMLGECKESVEIEHIISGTRLTISKRFLIKTLRKPSFYSYNIKVTVNTYMLSVPPVELSELPEDLQKYIKWGLESGTPEPSVNAYGKYWYSHVFKQIMTKKPFGHLFIPDKVDLTFRKRGVFANYSEKKVAASKNFYIVKGDNKTSIKLLTSWFNSTIFFSILLLLSRKISETWTRFLEEDYFEIPVINIKLINKRIAHELCKNLDDIIDRPLVPLWDQLGREYRYKLDVSVASALKLENPEKIIEKLYEILFDYKLNISMKSVISS